MPQVPTYHRQVGLGGMPSGQMPDAPPGAFGEGLAQGADNLGRAATQMAMEEKQKADQIAFMNADTQLSQFRQDFMYHPDTGAMYTQGRNAFGIVDKAKEAYNKQAAEIYNSLTNDDQRMAFERMAQHQWGVMKGDLERHTSAQITAYDHERTQASLDTTLRSAAQHAGDPKLVGMDIQKIAAVIKDQGARLGLPPEAVSDHIAQVTGQAHAAVLNQLLAANNYTAAKDYFDAHRGELAPGDSATFEKSLSDLSLRGRSQVSADRITTKYPDDKTKADAAVKEIKDPKLRDAVQGRVDDQFRRMAQDKAMRVNGLVEQAMRIVDGGGTMDDVQAKLGAHWNELSVKTQTGIKGLYEQMHADHPWLVAPTRQSVALTSKFDLMPQNKQASFTLTKLLDDYGGGKVTLEEFKAIRDTVVKARNAMGSGGDPNLTQFQSAVDLIVNGQKAAGLVDSLTGDPKDDAHAQEAQRFKQKVIDLVHASETATGKKLNQDEIQSIVAKQVAKVLYSQDVGRLMPVAAITPQEIRGGTITYDQIPAKQKAFILRKISQQTGEVFTFGGIADPSDRVIIKDAHGRKHQVYVGNLYTEEFKKLVTDVYSAYARGDTEGMTKIISDYTKAQKKNQPSPPQSAADVIARNVYVGGF